MSSSSVSKHPQYVDNAGKWTQMRDTTDGEHAVKSATIKYLPKTQGQIEDKVNGQDHYNAYVKRSVWFDYLANTQKDSIGMLHREPTILSLPTSMENYGNVASNEREDVQTFLRRIHEQQLIPGRCGLLVDIDSSISNVPYSILYPTERIINWDDSPDKRWIILDESEGIVDASTMSRTWKIKYKLLALDENDDYFVRDFTDWTPELLIPDDFAIYPVYQGRTMKRIPFTFCNSSNIVSDVENPPLLDLSNSVLSIYRGEADYRQTLFMQGFAVMFLKGFTEAELGTIRIGSGTYIHASGEDAEASFLEVAGAGLSEMRESQEGLKQYANKLGTSFEENASPESGVALSTKFSIKTASLQTIAITAVMALKQQLEYIVEWTKSTGDVMIQPNLDFLDNGAKAAEVNGMLLAVKDGGMTQEDYWKWLSERDLTSFTFEEWKQKVAVQDNN